FRNFEKAEYVHDLHQAFNGFTFSEDLESDSSRIVNLILEVANVHAPKIRRRARANTLPWIDRSPYIKKLMGLRSRLLKMSIPSPDTPPDLIIRQLYKTVRNRVNGAVKWAKKQYFAELFERCSDISKYWSLIKQSTGSNRIEQHIASLTLPDSGQILRDGAGIANSLNDHFTSVASKVSGHLTPADPSHGPTLSRPALNNIEVTANNVVQLLQKLDARSATGDDGLSPRLLRDGAEAIGPILAEFIRLCFEAGLYPSNWKSARITALFKKGQRDLPDNYRPISVIPAIGKIAESVLVEHFNSYDEAHQITVPEQWAFRKGRSTELALVHLTEVIRSSLNRGRMAMIVCVDVQKAFDCVRPDVLIHKMGGFGVQGALLEWLKSYLRGRRQRVAVNGHTSSARDVQCGIPQGSCFGPRAFSIFINDLPAAIETTGCTTVLYADDVTGVIEGESIDEVIARANSYLGKLKNWMDRNCMVVHPLKTEAVWCTRNNRRDPPTQQATYDGTPID
ncbi:MAG: reverse transcriptase family protein, partial [Gammaproteobacteria bacterium]|nr:reverse transcriptase family protein [Gammaproteobacteria bacterium]